MLDSYTDSERFDIVNHKDIITFALQDIYDDLDILRIRVQGFTDLVLTGAEKLLSKCILVDINYEFLPMYKDQKTYEYIHHYLRSNDYQLVSVTNLVRFSKVATYKIDQKYITDGAKEVLAKSNFYTKKEPYTSYRKNLDTLLNTLYKSKGEIDIISIIADIRLVEDKMNQLKYSQNPPDKTGLCKYLPNDNLIFSNAIYINTIIPRDNEDEQANEDKEYKYNMIKDNV